MRYGMESARVLIKWGGRIDAKKMEDPALSVQRWRNRSGNDLDGGFQTVEVKKNKAFVCMETLRPKVLNNGGQCVCVWESLEGERARLLWINAADSPFYGDCMLGVKPPTWSTEKN